MNQRSSKKKFNKIFKKKPSLQQMADRPRTITVTLSECPKVIVSEEGAENYCVPEGQTAYLVNVEKGPDHLPWIVILRKRMKTVRVSYNPVADTSEIVSPDVYAFAMNEFEYSYIR